MSKRRSAKGGNSNSRKTHTDIIRSTIEEEILTGVLIPGAALDEEKLAKRFEVSRTPVREAMLQLAQHGLIEKESRRSARVMKLDLRRLIQIFETVSELEGLCARFAARRITSTELKELKASLLASQEAMEVRDTKKYATLGRHFHYLIIKATHNEVLMETTNKIALHTRPYRRFQVSRVDGMHTNDRDHSEILKAIEMGDEETAYELMRRHVTFQGDVLAEYISMTDLARASG